MKDRRWGVLAALGSAWNADFGMGIARAEEREAPMLGRWEGLYPAHRLDLLSDAQRPTAAGCISDPATFAAVWKAWKPRDARPRVDFRTSALLFARNLRYLDHLCIEKVILRNGIASLSTVETKSSIPMEARCHLSIALVSRRGIAKLDTGEGVIDLPPAPGATATRVERPETGGAGTLYATIGGVERPIAKGAWAAWIPPDGSAVLYSAGNGVGGSGIEEQALYRYELATGDRKKLLAERAIIREVWEAETPKSRLAYVVSLRDGVTGTPATAILHPERGRVYRRDGVRVARIANGRVTLDLFERGAFEGADPQSVTPIRTECVDLDLVLRRGRR
jgi:hypothetical protein